MADERELIRESYRRILETDPNLRGQLDRLRALAGHASLKPALEGVRDRVGAMESIGPDSDLALETIVNRVGRPVLEVANDDYVVEGPEAAVWEVRLGNATVRAALQRVLPSVGRIEIDRHPDLTWVGTGWLIADDVVVTNRHVAEEFAARTGAADAPAYVFKRGWPDRNARMTARVDFRRELRNNSPRAFAVREVLHIEDDDGPDFAFLKVERVGSTGQLSPFLRPSGSAASAQQYVATVGYPAADSRIPEQDLMSRLFGDKYNVKRLAPGQVQRLSDGLLLHDCTTLGGNSGSPVIDLTTGEVLGLHFSGVFLRENRGVPVGYVTSRLQKVLHPGRAEEGQRQSQSPPPTPDGGRNGHTEAAVNVTIPLHIRVTLGAAALGGVVAVSSGGPALAPGVTDAGGAKPEGIGPAVNEARARLRGRSEVLAVRDGFAFRNGWITADPAVVVVLKDRAATPHDLGLPARVGGFPVEVRVASPWDLAEAQGRMEALEGVPRTAYKKPTGITLEEVHEEMTVTCHVSPDAGWPTLREFLRGTRKGLTVGMYDFTAPHIVEGVLDAVRDDPRKLTLVLQEGAAMQGKPDDIEEEKTLARYRRELAERFDHAKASVGKGRQFASAYHIKVAVRDSEAFWLSSGNWQSSNQPNHKEAAGETSWDLLRKHNREWHVVIENANLARQFEKFLFYDLKNAKADSEDPDAPVRPEAFFLVDEAVEERVPAGAPTYFRPLKITSRKVRVRPLLTPDNYQDHVLALIESAERRLLFQNQSLSLLGTDADGNDKNDPRFTALTDALLARQKAGVDVRIIIRGEFAPVGPLEQLQRRGFDMSKVRLQNRCHTKGIIVDGARVLVGSHNWTNQGTLVNRDASLIFDDEQIAGYFEDAFWFDWKHLTRQSVGARRARPAGDDESATPGMRRVSWREVVDGS